MSDHAGPEINTSHGTQGPRKIWLSISSLMYSPTPTPTATSSLLFLNPTSRWPLSRLLSVPGPVFFQTGPRLTPSHWLTAQAHLFLATQCKMSITSSSLLTALPRLALVLFSFPWHLSASNIHYSSLIYAYCCQSPPWQPKLPTNTSLRFVQ